MKYNNEFQTIDTEQKAYFLGFAFADGCISTASSKGNYSKKVFKLSLVDKDIIYELQSFFPFFKTDTFDYSIYSPNSKRQYALRKVSAKLYDDLYSQGMLERKSGENAEHLRFPSLPNKLIPHFIRGYFDGNGSISISKNRPNLRRIEICSRSKHFLLQIKELIETKGINCPIYREKTNKVLPLYVLEWINSKDVIDIRDYFYKDATIFLQRKKKSFDSFEIIDKKDNNPKCISCNSPTKKRGIRVMKHGMMQRFICLTCSKSFSIPAQVKSCELLESPEEGNQQPSFSEMS